MNSAAAETMTIQHSDDFDLSQIDLRVNPLGDGLDDYDAHAGGRASATASLAETTLAELPKPSSPLLLLVVVVVVLLVVVAPLLHLRARIRGGAGRRARRHARAPQPGALPRRVAPRRRSGSLRGLLLDGPDERRLVEIELALCRGDATARGLRGLTRFLGDTPAEVLWHRPASLQALVACVSAGGGGRGGQFLRSSSSTTLFRRFRRRPRTRLRRLLETALQAMEAVAAGLVMARERYGNEPGGRRCLGG